LKPRTTTIVVGIIGAVILVIVVASQYSAPTSSPLSTNVPLRPNSSTINPPPGGIPADVRCDWFVICGKYVILQDYTNSTSVIGKIGNNITLLGVDYKAGDYIELTEFGLARLSGDREKYSDPWKGGYLNNVCYPRSGKWRAERLPVENEPNRYINQVTLDLSAYLCSASFHLVCTVETSSRPAGGEGRTQLACDDGGRWVL
jgi:hypothetical protein